MHKYKRKKKKRVIIIIIFATIFQAFRWFSIFFSYSCTRTWWIHQFSCLVHGAPVSTKYRSIIVRVPCNLKQGRNEENLKECEWKEHGFTFAFPIYKLTNELYMYYNFFNNFLINIWRIIDRYFIQRNEYLWISRIYRER